MANNLLSNFSVISYNLHGYNQGSSLLNCICSSDNEWNIMFDCILIQEHWLTPCNLYKLVKFSKQYSFFGISAMEQAVSVSVIKGRPFGGVGILLKNKFASKIEFYKTSERFVICVFQHFVVISLYLPSVITESDFDTVVEIFDEIENVLQSYPNHKIICGGDYNAILTTNSKISSVINKFSDNYNLDICSNKLSSNKDIIDYTFFHETLKRYSYIDYFLVSKSVFDKITNYDIVESAFNLSDHHPVMLQMNVKFDAECLEPSLEDVKNVPQKVILRWDHSCTQNYYDSTREAFALTFNDVQLLAATANSTDCEELMINDIKAQIDEIYNKIVYNLNKSAMSTIVTKKVNFFKYWWDEEGDILKQESVTSHRLWVENGKPRCGPIYEVRTRAKLKYKTYLRQNMDNEKTEVSNSLHDALIQKNSTAFWKIWNKKFGKQKLNTNIINGCLKEDDIANSFANYFLKTSKM